VLLIVGALSYWQSGSGNGPGSAVPSEQPVAPGSAAPGAGSGGTQPATAPPAAQPPPFTQPAPPPRPAAGSQARQTPSGTAEPPAVSTPPPAPRPRFVPLTSGLIGRVSVHTQPQGARIFVNDAETAYRTPVNFSLAPGTYRLTVERNGYEQATQEIVVRQDQTASVQLELKRDEGRRSLLPFR
jgi:hypothetical protein